MTPSPSGLNIIAAFPGSRKNARDRSHVHNPVTVCLGDGEGGRRKGTETFFQPNLEHRICTSIKVIS